jgi:hypothetical protein
VSVKLPDYVSNFLNTFHNCSSLTDLYWCNPSAPTTAQQNTFNGCPSTGNVHTNGNQENDWKALSNIGPLVNWTYIPNIY